MTHREFTDEIKNRLGNVNFARLGRLTKKFKREFILDCIDKIPDYVTTPNGKLGYLTILCQKTYTEDDIVTKKKINLASYFSN